MTAQSNNVNALGALARGGASHLRLNVALEDLVTVGVPLDEEWDKRLHKDIPRSGRGCMYYDGIRIALARWWTLIPWVSLQCVRCMTDLTETREPSKAVDSLLITCL